ncbi:Uncharacterised protein [Mycobacteroides abscessus subsp. abscessus]|nr:Uncharacterised protein [Mycobacteroides abscessus subsp. abscessus]SKS52292.1 Uncharacterised protein [Mycobacteroides abscessus subsp. abscessus]
MGTLSTIWCDEAVLPVSSPPSRKTSNPFCAVAARRATGLVKEEMLKATAAP